MQHRGDLRDKKLLYHRTALANLPAILHQGLQPRRLLRAFVDVADPEILAGRREQGLDAMVPFHFFASTPFDGRVLKDRPGEAFALIAVGRSLARHRGWKILPIHPLSGQRPALLDYDAGIAAIDWGAMNRREYADPHSKHVCMAECLSPGAVAAADFQSIYVATEANKRQAQTWVQAAQAACYVDVNEAMVKR
jgi:hypothetical protein